MIIKERIFNKNENLTYLQFSINNFIEFQIFKEINNCVCTIFIQIDEGITNFKLYEVKISDFYDFVINILNGRTITKYIDENQTITIFFSENEIKLINNIILNKKDMDQLLYYIINKNIIDIGIIRNYKINNILNKI